MKLNKIQPSQLYISKRKLRKILKSFEPTNLSSLKVIPIKKLGSDIVYTDGHTSAYAAYLAGLDEIYVEWETEELDWEMYAVCVNWCKEAGITSIADLKTRLISHRKYKLLWYKRCKMMHQEILVRRK